MPKIILLDSGSNFIEQQFEDPEVNESIDRLDMYELDKVDLSGYVGMIVPGSIDQEWCLKQSQIFKDFLEEGKTVIFSGAIFRHWLPGAQPFVPKEVHGQPDYELTIVNSGGIFDGITSRDITTRRGVNGFFARGHHPLPEGAEVLVTFHSGEPVVYVDRQTTRGTIVVHAGNDMWSFGLQSNSSAHILPNLLNFIEREYSISRQVEV